jgi:ferritin-like metal-binding protein YciE
VDTQSIRGLLERSVRELHSAETLILAALPDMIHKASNAALHEALEDHYLLTQEHRRRLEAVAPKLRMQVNGELCYGLAGIVREGIATIQSARDTTARDLAIIACVEKIDHYEIASYSMLECYAIVLGEEEIAEVFRRTLDDERRADEKLGEMTAAQAGQASMKA